MRELTVKVADNQFDLLVSFLKTLPYVKLPKDLINSPVTDSTTVAENAPLYQNKPPLSIEELGVMDNEPWDNEYIKKHHTIDWSRFHEVVEMFKDIPLENYLEEETEPYI